MRHRAVAVVAAQIPLTSLADDVAAVRRTMRRQRGSLVLVGHSYGGAVVTAAGAGDSRVRNAVAHDASPETAAQLAAVQKPIAIKCLGEPMGKPAWKEVPAWFLIADRDRMVPPATQRSTAERMKATVVSLPVDHLPLASSHMEVADIIMGERITTIRGSITIGIMIIIGIIIT